MTRLTTGNRSVAEKVTLVTGAGSGIGRATAHLFADEGAQVVVTDARADTVDTVVEEITQAGGTAQGWVLDVTDGGAIQAVVDEVGTAIGGIDILVNNAGVNAFADIVAVRYEQVWFQAIEVNLAGQMRLIRACLPSLQRSSEGGRIVNVSSTEGLEATAYNSPYTVSKHGVVGLTRALAVELGQRNVTVNCVCPGPIRTGLTAAIPEEDKNKFARRRVPLHRYGNAEEVAHAILSLALPAASYINGAVLTVDGGMTAQAT
jgi:3-oxoacyl-[acyl-carrier protein] reductase